MKSHATRVSNAMRSDVWRDAADVRFQTIVGLDTCPSCGQVLTRDFHVDHQAPKFRELRDQFLSSQGLCLKDVRIRMREHRETKYPTLDDDQVRVAWQAYHAENAKLRALCAPCNVRDK